MKQEKKELLRRMHQKFQADAILVYSPQWHKENFRYLTRSNITGPYACILYLANKDEVHIFFTSEWDLAKNEKALSDIDGFHLLGVGTAGMTEFEDLLRANKVEVLGISGNKFLNARMQAAAKKAGAKLVLADGFLENERLVKTPEELGYLQQAVHLADQAWPVFLDGVSAGLNEYQIVANVEHYIKTHGAEDNFMLLATGGTDIRGMTPPTSRIAEPGDMVRTELTPQINGWWAQICRTCVKGKANENQKKAFEIFLESVLAGIDAAKPGVNISEVAKAENDVFRKYGFGEYCSEKYTRARGHGHGLDQDEQPLIAESTDLVLQENMVIVIHPNTYLPLCGYMVFGDPVVITKDGCRNMTNTERILFEA